MSLMGMSLREFINLITDSDDDEMKQCSKCEDWFLEDELKTTNLADGDFCEQCLQDLKEMR